MSATTTSPSKILITGLRVNAPIPQYFRDLYGSPTEIAAKIDADAQHIKDAGYDITHYYMDDEDPETGLKWLEAKLQEETFQGIMVGSGLRLIPLQTELFEKVVNVVRKNSPSSVLMFNDGPGGNFNAIMRNKESLG
jgi:hypothetical protein